MLVNRSYQQYLFKALKEIDVYQHFQVILLISNSGGRTTQKNICEKLQIERSHMVAIINVLIEKGYVTREVNFKDRRGKLISLTDGGNQVINNLNYSFAAFEQHIADEVTWQEMYNCLRVLNTINAKFKDFEMVNNEHFVAEKAWVNPALPKVESGNPFR